MTFVSGFVDISVDKHIMCVVYFVCVCVPVLHVCISHTNTSISNVCAASAKKDQHQTQTNNP